MAHTITITQPEQAYRFAAAADVPGVEPCDGWRLMSFDTPDCDGFYAPDYIARGPRDDVPLNVRRFSFTPTSERFAWLVRAGFPTRRALGRDFTGAWDDRLIDDQIRLCAAANAERPA